MKKLLTQAIVSVVLLALCMGASLAMAQQDPSPPDNGEKVRKETPDREAGPRRPERVDRERGDRDRRGRWGNPEEMRARVSNFMKERMNATDEEWTVIEPLLADVMEKRAEARDGAMSMFRARRGGDDEDSDSATADLRKALDSEETSSQDIKSKLEALRKERKGKEKELKAAQEKLRAVLTLRQEAQLVMMGFLD